MFSCKSDDAVENRFPVFTEQDLVFVHGTDSLTWVLTELQIDEELASMFEQPCLEDDVLTFYPGQKYANVTLGEVDCGNDERILTFLNLRIYFDDDSFEGAIRASLVIGYDWLSGGAGLVDLEDYYLLEANSDRLIFVLPVGDNVVKEDYRDYIRYYVLESVN